MIVVPSGQWLITIPGRLSLTLEDKDKMNADLWTYDNGKDGYQFCNNT
jgi:hypothetical protein